LKSTKSAAPPRICLVSHLHPTGNPRLVREAEALSAAGYDVIAVTTRVVPWFVPFDEKLTGSKWKHVFTDLIKRPVLRGFTSCRRKFFATISPVVTNRFAVERACCYAGPEMARLCRLQNADLYIAHTHAALPVAARAASATGARLGFDAEDLLADCSDEPGHLMRKIERQFVRKCSYVSTMSDAAADWLEQKLRLRQTPLVLHNVAALHERVSFQPPSKRASGGPLRVYWFGQTIGPHSCADQVLQAISRLPFPAILTLRGNSRHDYINSLVQLSEKLGIKDSLDIQPLAQPQDMVRLAASYDVLFASQPTAERFHDLAIGNKVFTGLMAGLGLLMTNTTAHRRLAGQIPKCTQLYDNNDIDQLADRLLIWGSSKEQLIAAQSAAWSAAESKFCWEMESQKLLECVAKLLPLDEERGGLHPTRRYFGKQPHRVE